MKQGLVLGLLSALSFGAALIVTGTPDGPAYNLGSLILILAAAVLLAATVSVLQWGGDDGGGGAVGGRSDGGPGGGQVAAGRTERCSQVVGVLHSARAVARSTCALSRERASVVIVPASGPSPLEASAPSTWTTAVRRAGCRRRWAGGVRLRVRGAHGSADGRGRPCRLNDACPTIPAWTAAASC
jgi:hypothetical protein